MATCLNNLGTVSSALGDHKAGYDYVARALSIDEKVYGPDHPAVATDLHNLGRLAALLEDKAHARELLFRSLQIMDKRDPKHPELVYILASLADFAESEADYPSAIRFAKRGLSIAAALGNNGAHIRDFLIRVGSLSALTGKSFRAKTYFEQALALAKQEGDPDNTAMVEALLGDVEVNLGHHLAALGHYDRSIQLFISLGNVKQATSVMHRWQYVQAML